MFIVRWWHHCNTALFTDKVWLLLLLLPTHPRIWEVRRAPLAVEPPLTASRAWSFSFFAYHCDHSHPEKNLKNNQKDGGFLVSWFLGFFISLFLSFFWKLFGSETQNLAGAYHCCIICWETHDFTSCPYSSLSLSCLENLSGDKGTRVIHTR